MKILVCKPVTTKKGAEKVFIQTAQADIWVGSKQFKSKGCSSSHESYVGGDIEADYYKVGEEMFDKTLCTKDNTILRDFSISANPAVLANALVIENTVKAQAIDDRASLFARGREVARAKALEAKLALETKGTQEGAIA